MATSVCRFCNNKLSYRFVDLGVMPLANAYLKPEQLVAEEPAYPLRASVCEKCWLVQADEFVAAADIFSHYAYFSSYSDSWVEHARLFTEMATRRFELTAASQVVEVASNDGYLLKHFVAAGIPSLGVEPAANVAEVARTAGVATECAFFGVATAEDLVKRGSSADLLVGNNVLAHVPDINDFVGGLAILLKPNGVLSVEFPHLLQLIDKVQFDTVYHEHFYYLSLLAVENVFAKFGLKVFDVEELPTHGGSLRVMAGLAASMTHPIGDGVKKVRDDEAAAGFYRVETYTAFQNRIAPIKDDLLHFLRQARSEGKSVAAYGAAAKGNTLLNFCGIGTDLIDYVVDRNPHKQDHLLPGSHLPIHSPDKFSETHPDFVLILPWNLTDEIVRSCSISPWGGRFVYAIPELTVLE